MTILGLPGVLFCENKHKQNGLSHVLRGGLKATVGNRVKPDYHFIRIVFCSILFLSARFLCFLAGYAQKHVSTYWILWVEV